MSTHRFDHQEAKDKGNREGEVKEPVEKDLRLLITAQNVFGCKDCQGEQGERKS